MKESHQVHVLHKMNGDHKGSGLAVGKVFKFPGSGDRYVVQASGAVKNLDPKPWRTKAGRKKYLRARREWRAANQ